PDTLTAVPNANQIVLTWNDNSTSESGFRIDRATDSAFTQNLTTLNAPANNTPTASFTDSNITPNITYYYRVRATNAAGDSANSNFASAVVLAPPAAPSNLAVVGVSA